MPIARRRAIADIARDYGVVIIEDDVYGFLLAERPPPLSVFAPELSYYVTSVSKSIAPGLRVGYALGPPDSGGRLAMSLQRSCRMATPLMAEIVGRWIADGTADALAAAQRDEIRARQAIAREILADTAYRTRPESYHLWLSLPEPWRADAFVERARGRGVLLTPADVFAIGRGAPHAVRICIGGVPDRDDVGRGLAIVMQTLHERPRPHLAVV
jgi:DNA-binding transcriptional MocR family regulator